MEQEIKTDKPKIDKETMAALKELKDISIKQKKIVTKDESTNTEKPKG